MHISFNKYDQLEALRERRPPWQRQIITSILPTVKMLSLGGETLPSTVSGHRENKVHTSQLETAPDAH